MRRRRALENRSAQADVNLGLIDEDKFVSDRFQLVNNLHEAIARDELVLVYQPQVDVGLREIIGAEALTFASITSR